VSILTREEIEGVVAVSHRDPHTVLGIHLVDGAVVVRAFRPDAKSVRVVPDDPKLAPVIAQRIHDGGLFEATFPNRKDVFRYRLDVEYVNHRFELRDPYAFLPTLGDIDIHLAAEGKHLRLYERLGAHVSEIDGVKGVAFAVWAPQAKRVSVVGDFNGWDGRLHAMRVLSQNGIWEIFVPEISEGAVYKFEVLSFSGDRLLKLDPFAFRTEVRPETAGIVHALDRYTFGDEAWLANRNAEDRLRRPMSIYEVHLGGFMRVPEERGTGATDVGTSHTGRFLTYRELAKSLVEHVKKSGFTHVELMPITEHPFDGSWGYQVTGYFAPTSRYGSPDDLRFLIDELHKANIGVILDWVPAHFPRDAHGLRRFDGTAVYEHLDPRQGEHADWGTMVFNFGRPEVRNFLLSSALFWLREYHFDGLRVDAVASMLYLDYSRGGAWVANKYGGRENLEAIAFLKELNERVHEEHPGAMVIAEESTAWPAVSRPVHLGGLGFTFKWNMGWMHDTLAYFSLDPIHRSHHHQKITFGFMYAWSESYVLPLSHDEVVHMKGSLIGKMPGDRFQRFANLRALYGYMWAHPGKKLLFMGGEFAQQSEFSEERSLDWHLLDDPRHGGVLRLVAELNRLYREHPALFEGDVVPEGFQWIDANDNDQSVASFLRWSNDRSDVLACVLNATPIPRDTYRIGVPREGTWRLLLDTDDERFGGSGSHVPVEVKSDPIAHHGFPQSIVLRIPPLSVLWFVGPEELPKLP